MSHLPAWLYTLLFGSAGGVLGTIGGFAIPIIYGRLSSADQELGGIIVIVFAFMLAAIGCIVGFIFGCISGIYCWRKAQ